MSELASVNIRLFPFAAALAKRGHTTFVADPEHLHQVLCARHSQSCRGVNDPLTLIKSRARPDYITIASAPCAFSNDVA
jgi:hypothetical protein